MALKMASAAMSHSERFRPREYSVWPMPVIAALSCHHSFDMKRL